MSVDDNIILSCAFRYALGRRTYVVDTVVRRILLQWDNIDQNSKDRMCKEIKEHKEEFGNIGDSVDEFAWNQILIKNGM